MDNSLEPESNQTIVWRFNHNRTYVVDPGKDQRISSAKHGVEECSLIARDIFSTSQSKLPTSPGQLPLKRPLQVSGDHLSEPRLLSPLRSSALQHSSQRSNRRALMLLMEEAVSLKIYEREGPEENSGEASHETPLLYS